MKKGKRVHPSPPTPLLPAAVLPLAAGLTAEEQEVLAYLLSGSGERKLRRQRRGTHEPQTGCGCFGCYKSFWARWDASPNRQLIHLIIDAFEDGSVENLEGGGRRRAGGEAAGERRGDVAEGGGGGTGDEEDEGVKSSVRRLMSFIGERVWRVWN